MPSNPQQQQGLASGQESPEREVRRENGSEKQEAEHRSWPRLSCLSLQQRSGDRNPEGLAACESASQAGNGTLVAGGDAVRSGGPSNVYGIEG